MRSLALLLALSITTSACTLGGPSPAPSTSAKQTGGTLVIAWQQPDTLDPLYAAGVQAAAAVYSLAVEGLVRALPDGSTGPLLAREVPTVENGLVTLGGGGMTVRYRLQPNVVWSDGAPFTSADVRYTWQRIMSDPKVSTREGYDRIAEVRTPDDLTADVVYRSVYPGYLSRFDAILPRHALEGKTDLTPYGSAPLGTGPFRITEFARGDHITAERNERYREAGKPYLDRVIFRFVTLEGAKAQLRAGEVHAALLVSEADAIDLEKDAQIRIDATPSPIVESLSFNLDRPQLSDRTVRRALILATPKEEIVRTLLGGRARVGRSEMPLGWAAAPGDVEQRAYDLDLARKRLEDTGWVAGADGVRVRDGVRLAVEITSTTGNPLREQVEQILADRWKRIGVAVTIRNVPSQTLTAPYASKGIRKRGDFDVVLHQLGLGTVGGTDPQAYLDQRHRCDAIPSDANKGAGGNWERFCDSDMDKMLADAATTLDVAKRRAVYQDVVRSVNRAALAIWLFERARINAFRSGVVGYSGNAWSTPTWDIAEWALAK